MKTNRTLTTIGGLLVAASAALAQIAPPAPPTPAVPPAAPAAPRPAPAPRAMLSGDWQDYSQDVQERVNEQVQAQIERAQEKMANANIQIRDKMDLAFQFTPQPAMPPMGKGRGGSDDSMYSNGLRFIDNREYDQALSEFNNVVSHGGARAEGALYWKAYVLNKLGRASEAQAAIDTLRKNYPNSSWLDDAKALELEVKQSKGPVSPEAESDDQMKVYALNGLMQSDPDKALPQVEKILKGSHSPNLKRQALYVIAQNGSPQAQQLLEQTARHGNPDLQVQAIRFLGQRRSANTAQILAEIYTSTSDTSVKRAVLDAFSNNRDNARIVGMLRGEKDSGLRSTMLGRLGDVDGQPELWQIYQSETTVDGKIAVLDAMRRNGNLDKLTEVARTDKEPKVRQKAIEIIATQESGSPLNTLVTLYSSEQDEKVKQTIIDNLTRGRGDCKPLIDVAKSEKDIKLKLRIVERLSSMARSCPAATDYLTELLSK